MKKITDLFFSVGVKVSLALLCMILIWESRPDAMTRKNQISLEALKPETKVISSQVSLLKEDEATESAKLASANGRLILSTEISDGTDKTEVYRQLILRGGKLISLDDNQTYHLLDGKRNTPLGKALKTNLSLNDYAFHRPREISPNDLSFLPIRVESQNQLFLVMPNSFEEGVFTKLESSLTDPLSEYKEAEVSIDLSSGNHLEFTFESAISRDGQKEIVGKTYRGF